MVIVKIKDIDSLSLKFTIIIIHYNNSYFNVILFVLSFINSEFLYCLH